ncbi:sensor histidine kinase [Stackebrandtia soli]|uniref:sensor histidine kinase n=1 Tax=Stackebrandtia soli TaxID=1892856 RepID=UPI0039E8451E
MDILLAEVRASGQAVTVRVNGDLSDARTLSAQHQRTVYRVIQEGLTNARKHAPSAAVTVDLGIEPEEAVTVAITNVMSPDGRDADGLGVGLTGLAERVAVDGGHLDHRIADGRFVLTARILWEP